MPLHFLILWCTRTDLPPSTCTCLPQTYVANTPFRLGRTWTGDILQLWIYGQSFNDFVPSPGGARRLAISGWACCCLKVGPLPHICAPRWVSITQSSGSTECLCALPGAVPAALLAAVECRTGSPLPSRLLHLALLAWPCRRRCCLAKVQGNKVAAATRTACRQHGWTAGWRVCKLHCPGGQPLAAEDGCL